MYKNHRCQLPCQPNVTGCFNVLIQDEKCLFTFHDVRISVFVVLNEALSILLLLLFLLQLLFDSTGCNAATDTGLVGCVVFVFVLDLHLDDVESLFHVSLRL